LSQLTETGASRNYISTYFTASANQSYYFGQTAATVDTVLILYRGVFNAASPGAHAVELNDDTSAARHLSTAGVTVTSCGYVNYCPQVTVTLQVGEEISLVTTTYRPDPSFSLPTTFYSSGPGSFGASPPTGITTILTNHSSNDLGTSVSPEFKGGTLVVTVSPGGTISQNFTLDNSGTNTIDQNGRKSYFSGVFSNETSNGSIIFANSGSGGSVVLTGTNTYTGGTTINAGATLQIGAGGTAGSIIGNVSNNGALIFNRSDAQSFAGVISGTGTLTQAGTNVLTLTGTNTYTGGTTINAGATLQIGAGGTAGSITGNVSNNGGLVFNRSDAQSFAGVVSGTGTLTQAGTNALTLTGTNTYTGGTTINAGAILIAANNAAFGTGTITMQEGSSMGFAPGGNYTVANRIVASGDPFVITPAGQTNTLSGVIADGTKPGIIEVLGGGRLVLTGANTYSGGTVIFAGSTLEIGDAGRIGSGGVQNAGTLVLSTPQTITGNYTQTGSLNINAQSLSNGGRLTTSGSASVNNAQVSFTTQNGYVPSKGTAYTLVSASSAGTSYSNNSLTLNAPGYNGLYNLATANIGGSSNLVLQFQANPTVYADTMMTNRDSFMGVSNAVSAQMAAFRGAPSSVGTQGVSAPNGMSVWFSGSGQYRRTSAGSSAPGFTSTGGGVVLGLDQMVSPRTHAGLVVAASGLNIKGGQGTSYSGQSVQMRAYATTQRGPAFVEAQAGILVEQGAVKRSVYGSGFARGTTNGAELGGTVRTGLRYTVSNWNIEPSVTLGAMTLTQNPLTESGAGASSMSIDRAGYLRHCTSRT
jgi:autotransporter-associated beta strand protein